MYFYDASVETDGESERAIGRFGAKGDGRRRGGEFGKFADEAAFFIFAGDFPRLNLLVSSSGRENCSARCPGGGVNLAIVRLEARDESPTVFVKRSARSVRRARRKEADVSVATRRQETVTFRREWGKLERRHRERRAFKRSEWFPTLITRPNPNARRRRSERVRSRGDEITLAVRRDGANLVPVSIQLANLGPERRLRENLFERWARERLRRDGFDTARVVLLHQTLLLGSRAQTSDVTREFLRVRTSKSLVGQSECRKFGAERFHGEGFCLGERLGRRLVAVAQTVHHGS